MIPSTCRSRPVLLALASIVVAVGTASQPVGAIPGPAVGDRALGLRVVDQSFGVGAGDALAATIELTGSADALAEVAAVMGSSTPAAVPTTAGPTTTAPAAATGSDATAAGVRVTVHDLITDAGQLESIDRDGPTGGRDSVVLPAAEVFAAGGLPRGSLAVPVVVGDADGDPATGLSVARTGVYPVTIDVVVDGDAIASATTFVEVFDPDAATTTQPLAVSILAGVADPGPWPSPTELRSASIEVAQLVELADAVDGPLTISLPPGLVSALSAEAPVADPATTTAPPTTAATEASEASDETVLPGTPGATEPAFAGLESPAVLADAFRGDELVAAPALALDPSALIPLGQEALFTDQLRAGEDALSNASPRAVVSRTVWLADGPVSAAAMVALRNLGIRMLVVPDETASALGVPAGPSATGVFAVNLTADGSLPAMTSSSLGVQLRAPLPGEDTPAANERAVRLLVELQLQRRLSGAPAVLLATPRRTVPDPAVTAQFVALAAGLPDISVVPISRLPGLVDGSATPDEATPVTLPATAGPDLSERLARVAEARIHASHAGRMLADPARATGWSTDLNLVLSTAVDDATAFEHLDGVQAEIDRVLNAIVPPGSGTFRLTGTSSRLRLEIGNTYDQPLNVVIHLRSPKLRFPEPDPERTIPAGESILVEIPVEARSNGTFTIEVDVLAPDRSPLADPVILKARVTRLTGLSQVITGAAVLVLASWWYSHIRRSRRLPAAADADLSTRGADGVGVTVSPDAAEALAPPPPTGSPGPPGTGSGTADEPG